MNTTTRYTVHNYIDINEVRDLQYWSHKFNVSPNILREAVAAIGPAAAAVEHYLRHVKRMAA